jgi:hypothetical protein
MDKKAISFGRRLSKNGNYNSLLHQQANVKW